MVPALLLIFLHMLLTGVSGNYHINAPPTFVSRDRRNLRSDPISGFISIDCGRKLPEDTLNYTDEETDIVYTSDMELIDTGECKKVLTNSDSNPNWKILENIRSFPFGTKNCYTFEPEQGRNKTYLVRATFMYGNYDSKKSPPVFDLYLGPNLWDTITFDNVTHLVIKEIMHVFPMDFLDICLLNTNTGVPFISALELRHISNDGIYRLDSASLETCVRYDYGRYITEPPVRYPEDAYDRIWYPVIWDTDLISINSLLTEDSLSDNDYKPPAMVMRTAITTSSINGSISIYWTPPSGQAGYYIYMHFAELKNFNKTREFVIDLNDERWMNGISLLYLRPVTVFNSASLKGLQLEFRIYATNESNLPPLLNTVEFYKVRKFTQLPTQQDDVEAVINIKKFYTIKKHWQGDPCLPDESYMWDGLNCSYKDNSPRIIMLNLSSSGIAGVIAEPLSKLSSLQILDLSYNRLNGTIPEFLSQIPSLKILNLRANNLSGSVPRVLTEKFKNRTLLLSLDDNPELCSTLCTKEKKNKDTNKKLIVVGGVSVAVATTISLSMVLSVALGFFWKYKWQWDGGEMANETYKGNSISQPQRVFNTEETTSQDQIMNSSNAATRDDLSNGVQITDTNESYPPNSSGPTKDQELWKKSSVLKKFLKGPRQQQRASNNGSRSSGSQSTPHTPVDFVKAICRDPTLLRTLQTHLKALSSDNLSDIVAPTPRQQEEDQEYDEEATSQGQNVNLSDVATRDDLSDDVQITDTNNHLMDESYPPSSMGPTNDQELWKKSLIVKKNIVKGQRQQQQASNSGSRNSGSQLTQSSFQSTPPTILQTHLEALSPDNLADTIMPTTIQQEEDQEYDEKATSQGQNVNFSDVATRDDLSNDVQIADTDNQLMDGNYSPGSMGPTNDQELWKKSLIVKKNIVKGQRQQQRASNSGYRNSGSQLTQSSYQSTPPTILQTHLEALSPDNLTNTIVPTTIQQEEDQEYDEEATSQGQNVNFSDLATRDDLSDDVQIADTDNKLMDGNYPPGSMGPTNDQELWKKSLIVKKNIVKVQRQQQQASNSGSRNFGSQLTQSSYQSTPPTILQTHLEALSLDNLANTITPTTIQQEEDQEYDEEATSQGQNVNFSDVATRDDLFDDVQIADTDNQLMDKSYPPGSMGPMNDQELWKKSLIMKKNIVKGQRQHQQASNSGSRNSGSQLTQLLYQSTPPTILETHLEALSHDNLADTIAPTAIQQEENQEYDEDIGNQLMDESYLPGSMAPRNDQELWKKSLIVKKNIVKGQRQQQQVSNSGFRNSCSQLTQSSYQSTPTTKLQTHLEALSPSNLADTIAPTTIQQEEDQEYDEDATSQGRNVNLPNVATRDDLSDVATRDDLSDDTDNQLMDESYPPGSIGLMKDQELWKKCSFVKKNFVKGQEQQQRVSNSGSRSSGNQLMQSSYQSAPHTILQTHLKALSPDDLAYSVAPTTRQQDEDQEHDVETTSQGQNVNLSDVATCDDLSDVVQIVDTDSQLTDESYPPSSFGPTKDQELLKKSLVVKKNFIKGQGQQQQASNSGSRSSGRQLAQALYQSIPHTLQTHLKDASLDDFAYTIALTTRQQEKDREHDEEATSQGQNVNLSDVVTCDDLSDVVQIADTENQLMDESYPPGSLGPSNDQELWKKSSVVKKNFVKGQGQQHKASNSGSHSSGSQLTQSLYQSTPHTLQTHLKDASLDDLAYTVAPTTRQQEEDQEHDEDIDNQLMVESYPSGSLGLMKDQELWEKSSFMKKNFVKGQGLQPRASNSDSHVSGNQLTQSLYQSSPHTLQTHLKDVSLDDLADTVVPTTRQHEEDEEHDEDIDNQLMDESYPLSSLGSTKNQESWKKSLVAKKNFVKGQEQQQRPGNSGSRSSGRQLTQSSYQSMPHTLQTHLKDVSHVDLTDTVAPTTPQQQEDQEHEEEDLDDNA